MSYRNVGYSLLLHLVGCRVKACLLAISYSTTVFLYKSAGAVGHFCLAQAFITQILLAIDVMVMARKHRGKTLVNELVYPFVPAYRLFKMDRKGAPLLQWFA